MMDMTKIDEEIDTLRREGKTPILLLGVDTMKELIAENKIIRSPGVVATYRGASVILNACNPDKCEVVVRE